MNLEKSDEEDSDDVTSVPYETEVKSETEKWPTRLAAKASGMSHDTSR